MLEQKIIDFKKMKKQMEEIILNYEDIENELRANLESVPADKIKLALFQAKYFDKTFEQIISKLEKIKEDSENGKNKTE